MRLKNYFDKKNYFQNKEVTVTFVAVRIIITNDICHIL